MLVTRETLQSIWNKHYIENQVDEIMGVLEHINQLNPMKTILEIGVCFGGSLRIWEQVVPPGEGTVIAIDIRPYIEDALTGKLVEKKSGKSGNWEVEWRKGPVIKLKSDRQIYVVVGDSANPKVARQVAELLNGNQIDFIFHDGQHYGPTPVYDYQNFQDLFRDGGLLCVADVCDITKPEQIVDNAGCQSLALELPEPKLPKVSGHAGGMCLWKKQPGYVFDAAPVVEKYNLSIDPARGAWLSIDPATYY